MLVAITICFIDCRKKLKIIIRVYIFNCNLSLVASRTAYSLVPKPWPTWARPHTTTTWPNNRTLHYTWPQLRTPPTIIRQACQRIICTRWAAAIGIRSRAARWMSRRRRRITTTTSIIIIIIRRTVCSSRQASTASIRSTMRSMPRIIRRWVRPRPISSRSIRRQRLPPPLPMCSQASSPSSRSIRESSKRSPSGSSSAALSSVSLRPMLDSSWANSSCLESVP